MNSVLLTPAGQTARGLAADPGVGDVSLLQQVLQRLVSVDAKLDDVRSLLSRHHKDQYTVEEFARIVGRSAYTIRRWVSEQRLRAIRVSGTGARGRLLIPRDELLRLVAAGKGGAVPDAILDGSSEPPC